MINPVSILYKSVAGRYRPVSYPDGPITAPYRFIKNAYWEVAKYFMLMPLQQIFFLQLLRICVMCVMSHTNGLRVVTYNKLDWLQSFLFFSFFCFLNFY